MPGTTVFSLFTVTISSSLILTILCRMAHMKRCTKRLWKQAMIWLSVMYSVLIPEKYIIQAFIEKHFVMPMIRQAF